MKSMDSIPNPRSFQQAVSHVALEIAVPLADLLLDARMRADDLVAVLRHAFVEAACHRARALKREPKAAGIARQTGVALDEVMHWMRRPPRPVSAPRRARSQAERVLWRWWTEPSFNDPWKRQPVVLPMTGADRSFERLVRDCTGSVRASPRILRELVAIHAVRRLKGNRLRVVRQTALAKGDAESLNVLGRQVRRHFEGLLREMRGADPESSVFVRGVESVPLDPSYLPILRRDFRAQVGLFLDSARETLSFRRYHGGRRRDSRRVAIALHVVDEPVASGVVRTTQGRYRRS